MRGGSRTRRGDLALRVEGPFRGARRAVRGFARRPSRTSPWRASPWPRRWRTPATLSTTTGWSTRAGCAAASAVLPGVHRVSNSPFVYDACGRCQDPAGQDTFTFNATCNACTGTSTAPRSWTTAGCVATPWIRSSLARASPTIISADASDATASQTAATSSTRVACARVWVAPSDETKRSWCCDCAGCPSVRTSSTSAASAWTGSHWGALSGAKGPPRITPVLNFYGPGGDPSLQTPTPPQRICARTSLIAQPRDWVRRSIAARRCTRRTWTPSRTSTRLGGDLAPEFGRSQRVLLGRVPHGERVQPAGHLRGVRRRQQHVPRMRAERAEPARVSHSGRRALLGRLRGVRRRAGLRRRLRRVLRRKRDVRRVRRRAEQRKGDGRMRRIARFSVFKFHGPTWGGGERIQRSRRVSRGVRRRGGGCCGCDGTPNGGHTLDRCGACFDQGDENNTHLVNATCNECDGVAHSGVVSITARAGATRDTTTRATTTCCTRVNFRRRPSTRTPRLTRCTSPRRASGRSMSVENVEGGDTTVRRAWGATGCTVRGWFGRMRLRRRLLHVHRRGDGCLTTANRRVGDGQGWIARARSCARAGRTDRTTPGCAEAFPNGTDGNGQAPRERILVSTRQSTGSAAV